MPGAHTKIYSGGEPDLIEGDIFKTIIPLERSVTPKVTDKVTDKVTENEAEVLTLISENPNITQTEMAKRLSVSRKTIASRLKSLKEKGVVKRVGPDIKGYWEIQR